MKLDKILAVILIAVSTLLTETHSFILNKYPKAINETVDIFLSPHYKQQVNVFWMIKMTFESLNLISIFFALMILFSDNKLFYIFGLFFIYYVLDFFLLMWNFKETAEIYWVMGALCLIFTILLLIFNPKYKMHIVKN